MNDWSTAERLGLGEGQVFLFQVWFGLSGSFRKGHRQHIGHIEVEDLEIDSLQMFYLASVPPGKSVDPQGDEYYLKTSCLRAHFWVLLPQCWAGTPELVSYLSLYAPLPRYFHPPKTFFFPHRMKNFLTRWEPLHNVVCADLMLSFPPPSPRPQESQAPTQGPPGSFRNVHCPFLPLCPCSLCQGVLFSR